MTAIAACFAGRSASRDDSRAEHLLDSMRFLGPDEAREWHDEQASLACCRFEWESESSHAGATLVAESSRTVVVADATLYYTRALLEALRAGGSAPQSTGAVSLILAAYELWGDQLGVHLEGDFAAVIWDRVRRRALLLRDFVGRRPLFVRDMGDGVAIASRATTLARGCGANARINVDLVAAAMGGLLGGSRHSAFEGVLPVLAGTTMEWVAGQPLRTLHLWEPPPFRSGGRADFESGAIELQRLLRDAVAERATAESTVVWLSGGADSTAVFAAGSAVRIANGAPPLWPISVSFPHGDSARENEHIEALAARFGAPVSWIESEAMNIFDGLEARSARHDDPYAHTFEVFNRTLAATSASRGGRIALDGYGGDSLFQVSDAFVSEVLFTGDLRLWVAACRAAELTNWRSLLRWGVLPSLPDAVWRGIDAMRQRPMNRRFVQDIPPWLSRAAGARLLARGWNRSEVTRRRGEGPAAFESRWYLTSPYMSRAVAWTHHFAVTSGVELRSPLLDRRVVEFAASRPVAERGTIGDSKRLLKASMRGLIPESVLAPRPYKTGVPRGFLHRQYARGLRRSVDSAFGRRAGSGPSTALADMGLLDIDQLRSALERYEASGDHLTGVQIYLTLEAELWIRGAGG